ncbi:MAG: ABC transporter ATP-binding protein [Candidatus Methanomethylophilaceae archaeon]|nr:ABC transporter ATP-binding protein [Candidatus Methanomethylophilaceae archaeon]
MIFRFFRGRDWAMVSLAVILLVCQIWMDILIPQYMSRITDAFLLSETDVVMKYGSEMIVCAFLSLAFSLAVGFVLANVSASVGRNMRIQQFDRVQAFSEEDIGRFSASSLITRSTNDVTQIQNFIARGLQTVIKCPILTVWALSMIYGSSFEWTLITASGAVVLIFVMLFTLHFARRRFQRIQWLTDGVNRATKENIDGIRVIRAYNAERYQESRFEKASGDLMENNISAAAIMAPAFPLAQSMVNFVTLGIYWMGALMIAAADTQEGQLNLFSDMIVFTSYATMVLAAFMQMFGVMRMLPRTLVGLKRIGEVVDTEPSVTDGTVTAGTECGTVEFRDVSFSYPGSDREAISNISFRVEKGQTLAIIGTTGSGKSSMVNLIPRFYDPTSGRIIVDGIDVREFSRESLRSRLGYVSQDAIIFSGSVEGNVNYGLHSEDRGPDDVDRALRIANADGFVSSMEDGIRSHVSQHGKNLSGGQKQRISIARAVCRSPEILILDDSFSALDFKTDLELRNRLHSEMSGCTIIMVAQRIGTIMDADEILVLSEGRIVGKGTHEELMADCPEYRDMARSQMVGGAV